MEKQSFIKRVVVPAAIVFAVMAVSFIAYNTAWHIKVEFIHKLVVNIAAVVLFLCVGFSPFAVYTMSYFRGATFRERVLATLINPAAWAIKEVVRVTATFSIGESIYFLFNPLIISLFAAVIAQVGLLEMLCRRSLKKRGENVEVFSVPSLAAIIAGLSIFVINLAWEQGVHSFYLFMEGYKLLFGFGL